MLHVFGISFRNRCPVSGHLLRNERATGHTGNQQILGFHWCGFCCIMCVATHSVTGAQFPGTCYGISAANIFILHCFGCCMCLVSYFVTGARFPGTCYEMSELTFSYVIVADVSAVCLKSPLPIYKPLERIALGLLGLPRCYVFNEQSIGNTLLHSSKIGCPHHGPPRAGPVSFDCFGNQGLDPPPSPRPPGTFALCSYKQYFP